jgi:hypothetical protein
MGREVRRVPANWEHPKRDGKHIPMHAHMKYSADEILEGLRDGWLKDEPPNYGLDIMPQWPDAERTHLQMYEDCSEGTPISPVMSTAEELARWLADNKASAFAGMTASYEAWLDTIRRGWAVFAANRNGRLESGVEAGLSQDGYADISGGEPL